MAAKWFNSLDTNSKVIPCFFFLRLLWTIPRASRKLQYNADYISFFMQFSLNTCPKVGSSFPIFTKNQENKYLQINLNFHELLWCLKEKVVIHQHCWFYYFHTYFRLICTDNIFSPRNFPPCKAVGRSENPECHE